MYKIRTTVKFAIRNVLPDCFWISPEEISQLCHSKDRVEQS